MLNPSRCRILAIGKIRRVWIREGIELYMNRLQGLSIVELKDSTPEKEANAIQSALLPNEMLVPLMEQGETLASIPFALRLENLGSIRIAFVIGGTNGLSQDLKSTAQWKLSLSPMTFPHELARLILVEQIFRAQTILQGSPYHRA